MTLIILNRHETDKVFLYELSFASLSMAELEAHHVFKKSCPILRRTLGYGILGGLLVVAKYLAAVSVQSS